MSPSIVARVGYTVIHAGKSDGRMWKMISAAFVILAVMVEAQTLLGGPPVAPTDPLTPQEQLGKFHLPPGFEIQLVASEPDIQKPMNLNFDARGRLWVTHSIEY